MSPWWNDDSVQAGTPADGPHDARLERLTEPKGREDDLLVAEWSAEGIKWPTFYSLGNDRGKAAARALMDALGIDLDNLRDNFDAQPAYDDACGATYRVRTKAREGSDPGRPFIDTIVEGRAAQPSPPAQPAQQPPAQTQIPAAQPAPEPQPVAAGQPENLPF